MHHTVPQPQLGGRGADRSVAKALGGGSAVNAMVYMRGQQEKDYDGWAAYLGNEDTNGSTPICCRTSKGSRRIPASTTRYHGISGNLRISEPRPYLGHHGGFPSRRHRAWAHPYNADFNGVRQKRRRHHAAYVWPVERQDGAHRRQKGVPRSVLARDERLTIITDARVDEIVHQRPRYRRALYAKNGESHTMRASRKRNRWLLRGPITAPS